MRFNNIIKYLYLAPAGFTMPYNLGICKFIKEHYPLDDYKFIGSSAGSWLSVFLASDMNLNDKMIKDYSELFENRGILYKWHNVCPFLEKEYTDRINDNQFILDKRVKISISNYNNKTVSNILIDDYENLQELLNLCTVSSYIPILSGLKMPLVNNSITFDGYFTEPEFEHRRISLKICNSMFDRHFTFFDVIGKSKLNIDELISIFFIFFIKQYLNLKI